MNSDLSLLFNLVLKYIECLIFLHAQLRHWPTHMGPQKKTGEGGSKGDTPISHRSLLYRAQDSS